MIDTLLQKIGICWIKDAMIFLAFLKKKKKKKKKWKRDRGLVIIVLAKNPSIFLSFFFFFFCLSFKFLPPFYFRPSLVYIVTPVAKQNTSTRAHLYPGKSITAKISIVPGHLSRRLCESAGFQFDFPHGRTYSEVFGRIPPTIQVPRTRNASGSRFEHLNHHRLWEKSRMEGTRVEGNSREKDRSGLDLSGFETKIKIKEMVLLYFFFLH